MRAAVFALVPAVFLAIPALTQEPAAITKVRTAPGFHTAAEGQFQRYEQSLSTHCAAVAIDWTKATHTVYGTAQTGADGNLTNATWVETVPGAACGQPMRFRVLVLIRAGRASVVAILPGESYASPQLERDAALPLAGATAAFVPKDQKCAVDVLDTKLVGGAPTAPKQPWNEVWTVSTCGKRLSVPIEFVPDAVGEGTSIHITSKAVTALP